MQKRPRHEPLPSICPPSTPMKKPKVNKPKMDLAQRLANRLGEDYVKHLFQATKFFKTSGRWVRFPFQFTLRFEWDGAGVLHIFACEVDRKLRKKESDAVSHYYDTVVVAPDETHELYFLRIICNTEGVHVYFKDGIRVDVAGQTKVGNTSSFGTHCD